MGMLSTLYNILDEVPSPFQWLLSTIRYKIGPFTIHMKVVIIIGMVQVSFQFCSYVTALLLLAT